MKLILRKSFWQILFTLTLTSLSLMGCSSSPAKTESESSPSVKSEPKALPSSDDILQQAAGTFANAPGLTEEQKQKLKTIYMRTAAEASVIRNEINQAKSLLFKTIATASYQSSDVERLKKKIVDLDQKRLKVMFKSLADVQAVVGFGRDKEDIYERLRDYEFPRGNAFTGQ